MKNRLARTSHVGTSRCVGRSLQGEEQPYDPERIASFQRIRKNGRSSLAGQPGKSPAASFRSGGAGVELIALAARSAPGDRKHT